MTYSMLQTSTIAESVWFKAPFQFESYLNVKLLFFKSYSITRQSVPADTRKFS